MRSPTEDEPSRRHCWLVRPRRQRSPGYGAAKQRDELATPHSKTSSVLENSVLQTADERRI
jgi:hypothetical protein